MPKVALMSRGSPDYLIDIVSDGMIRLLGRENICLEYNRLHANDSKVSHLFDGFEAPNRFELYDADVLVTSLRVDFNQLVEWKKRTGGRKVIVLDGADESHCYENFVNAAHVYFKRELVSTSNYPGNVKPLPFAAIPEARPSPSIRNTPVFFRASRTDEIRPRIEEELSALGHPPETSPMSKDEYNARLADSAVAVSARGAGWDTYRYWEIPYFGCLLLSQRLPIVIPFNFVEGEEAVFFDTFEDLRSKLRRLLADAPSLARIAASGQKACDERHLSVHRAKTVLEAAL